MNKSTFITPEKEQSSIPYQYKYQVYKHTKDRLDNLPCDLLRRLELKKVYIQSRDLLRKNNENVFSTDLENTIYQLDIEINASIFHKLTIPLHIYAF